MQQRRSLSLDFISGTRMSKVSLGPKPSAKHFALDGSNGFAGESMTTVT